MPAALLLLSVSVFLVFGSSARVGASAMLENRIRVEAAGFVTQLVKVPSDSVRTTVDIPSISLDEHEIEEVTFELLSSRPVIGTVPLRVSLRLKDGGELPFTATARVRVYNTVAVAARRLGRHETIEENDLRFEQCEVTQVTDGYFTEPGDVVGKRAKRIISAGTLIRDGDIQPVPLIERGSSVTVSVVIGAVTVTSKAKALEDGELGALIQVQDLITRKRLTGAVAGRRLVVLDKTML
jgi:flagella basal body P-ring formation protein FlgA